MTTFLRAALTVAILACSSLAEAQAIAFRAGDGRLLYGDVYGSGDRGVVILAHGGYSSRASWKDTAEALRNARFHVLVFESRGAADLAAGRETPCLSDEVCQSKDVVSAIRQLQELGATSVALIGGSLGGAAVALAAIETGPRVVESLVLLAPAEVPAPEMIPSRKLFIVSRNDANAAGLRLPGIRAQFARAQPPKEFKLLEGSAHGQQMLFTPDGAALCRDIIRFLENGRH
jgi:pimeloyl-ACP methyl ester carboxylesterase